MRVTKTVSDELSEFSTPMLGPRGGGTFVGEYTAHTDIYFHMGKPLREVLPPLPGLGGPAQSGPIGPP